MTRTPEQIAASIWVQNAASYLKYLRLDREQQAFYASVYHTGDIELWARELIAKAIEKAHEKLELTAGGRCIVRNVAQCSLDVLHDMGLSGSVQLVGFTKIE